MNEKRSVAFLLLLMTLACGGPEGEGSPPRVSQQPEQSPTTNGLKPVVQVWKSPTCGCCAAWVEHLRASGYPVQVEDVADMSAVKRDLAIPGHLTSCHTAQVGGYALEGHVPADAIDRLLAERPEVAGISVPGMPVGAPGMEVPGRAADPYAVISFTSAGDQEVFEQR